MNSSRSQYSDREYANHDVELLSDEPGLGVARGHTIIRKGEDRHIGMGCLEMKRIAFATLLGAAVKSIKKERSKQLRLLCTLSFTLKAGWKPSN